MSEVNLSFPNPPIVEAVVDVDCDLPTAFNLVDLEGPAQAAFRDSYPKMRKQHLHEFSVAMNAGEPTDQSTRHGLQALQFLHDDEKQLVQVRASGYSFNRLAPYLGFGVCLPEIQRTWEIYFSLVCPIKIRAVRVRYINRIRLPLENGRVDLDEYFKNGPRVAEGAGLNLAGFLNQYRAIESRTGYAVATVLTAESVVGDILPVIFDNMAWANVDIEPDDWPSFKAVLQGLQDLKNRVFRSTLGDKCLSLFQ